MRLYIWRRVLIPIGGRFLKNMYRILPGPDFYKLLQLCSAMSSYEISKYLLKSSLFWLKDDVGISGVEFLRVMKSNL